MSSAQRSLLATALNNLGVGSFLTGVVAPQISNHTYEARWFVLAILAHIAAQLVLEDSSPCRTLSGSRTEFWP
jgi:hypothetical protein